MASTVFHLLSRLRPRDNRLPEETRSQVQVHRLLCLLGSGLVVAFAPLYAAATPNAVDPLWARLGIAGLFLTLLAASYLSPRVREAFVSYVWGALYLIMGWFAVIAALNQFAGEYAVGLLLIYAVLAAIVAFGAESVQAVLWFLGYGGLLTALGALAGPRPQTSPLILIASMGTIALVETVLTQGWLWIRDTVREQESRLRGFTNSLPGVVFQFYARDDGTMGHHFVSEHAEDVLGVEPDPETFHEQCMASIPEQSQREMERSIETAIEEETAWEFETAFDKPDGERIWALGASTPERREDEIVFNGVILDITERKEAERRRKTYEELKESAEDAIVIADADGKIIDWNPGAESIFGYEKEAIVGRPFETLLPDRYREPYRREMERVLETGHGKVLDETVELEGLRTDGHEVPVELSLSSWEADRDRFFGAIIRDITERKNAEQALREERDRFETLFELLPTPVVRCVAGDDGVFITDANPAFEDTFGVAAAEAAGAEINQLLVPEEGHDRAREFDRQALEDGFVRDEVQRTTAEGVREFQIQAVCRRPEEGPAEMYAVYTDITERKRREQRLREAKEEAEEASRLKSAVLANMSHELRTPLTSILGFAEAIDEEVNDGEGPVSRFASLIARSGERLLRTIDNVLNFSRLEAEEQGTAAEPVDVAATARAVVDELRVQAEENDVTLRTEGLDATVRTWAPLEQVRIVLRHLLSNAIKYTESGGTVWLRVDRAGDDVMVEVEDTGIGMEPAEVPELFEPFRQASEGLGREYEGTGLGLAVVQRAVDRMGGTIDVETEPGAGTCVTVILRATEEGNGDVAPREA